MNSRTKGHGYEREIAAKFRKAGFKDAKRHLEYQFEEALGVDLDNTGQFRVQCKRGRKYAPISKIFEIKVEGVPLLITRGDRTEDMAVLPLKNFLEILQNIGIINLG